MFLSFEPHKIKWWRASEQTNQSDQKRTIFTDQNSWSWSQTLLWVNVFDYPLQTTLYSSHGHREKVSMVACL